MTVYNKNNPETIQAMFGSIAHSYDKANAFLSLQMHKRWNAQLVSLTTADQPATILDLCCGTGDIAFAYLKGASAEKQAIMLDFCEEMLVHAKDKAARLKLHHHEITYIQADAQSIPLESGTIPCATMAYGIRNIKDPSKCIHDVYRVLKPGGVFGILELTRPANPLIRFGHHIYLKTMLPLMGEAYRYLCNSIHEFIPPETLEKMMQEAGFQRITKKRLMFGTATILIGHKHARV